MGVRPEFEITREFVETDVTFLLLRSVTAGAVFLEEGLVRLRGVEVQAGS
jgi:hypothetical protein